MGLWCWAFASVMPRSKWHYTNATCLLARSAERPHSLNLFTSAASRLSDVTALADANQAGCTPVILDLQTCLICISRIYDSMRVGGIRSCKMATARSIDSTTRPNSSARRHCNCPVWQLASNTVRLAFTLFWLVSTWLATVTTDVD